MIINARQLLTIAVLVFYIGITSANETAACSALANTPLEKLYCQIKAKGEGRTLPDFASFQKNAPKIQRLLLKRDAEKLGLALPNLTSEKAKSAQKAKPATKAITEALAPSKHSYNSSLSGCRFQRNKILCNDGRRFSVINNLRNSALGKDALGPQNKLLLPRRETFKNEGDLFYLSRAYETYLTKMLEIGMGASTMTFTRFHGIYQDSVKRNFSFTERFTRMYEFLKTDKKQNAIPKRLNNESPKNIDHCELLGAVLVVCDNGKTNWLFETR